MKSPREPEAITPDQRRREIAAILAQGVLCCRRMATLRPLPDSPESYPHPQNPLELSRESRLHVGDGSAG